MVQQLVAGDVVVAIKDRLSDNAGGVDRHRLTRLFAGFRGWRGRR